MLARKLKEDQEISGHADPPVTAHGLARDGGGIYFQLLKISVTINRSVIWNEDA